MLLKTLSLVGFKSFADRTRLEFGSGVNVVVGPNGTGKSNILDAIKNRDEEAVTEAITHHLSRLDDVVSSIRKSHANYFED